MDEQTSRRSIPQKSWKFWEGRLLDQETKSSPAPSLGMAPPLVPRDSTVRSLVEAEALSPKKSALSGLLDRTARAI